MTGLLRRPPPCEEFFLYLSSSDSRTGGSNSNFTINLPEPRTLTGSWRMALKEITHTAWYKERSFGSESEFLVFADENHAGEWDAFIRKVMDERWGIVKEYFSKGRIPGIPHVAVVTFYKKPGSLSAGMVCDPSGFFSSAEEYIRAYNTTLRTMFEEGYFYDAPYFYMVDENKGYKTVGNNWNYPANLWRKVGVMPIMSADNRHLLGIPAKRDSDDMIDLLKKAWLSVNPGFPNVLMGEEGFKQHTDNIFVLCDLVRTTGARVDEEGQILRAIPNKQEEEGRVVHHDFTEDYYEITPKSSFFTIKIRLVSARTYKDLNLAHPVSLTLHFKPTNQCQSASRPVIV